MTQLQPDRTNSQRSLDKSLMAANFLNLFEEVWQTPYPETEGVNQSINKYKLLVGRYEEQIQSLSSELGDRTTETRSLKEELQGKKRLEIQVRVYNEITSNYKHFDRL